MFEKEIEIKNRSVKKRGRKKKNEIREYELNKEQTRFVVDLKGSEKELEKIQNILVEANKKEVGREVTFADVVIYLTRRLNQKDIEKIREKTFSIKDKLMMEHKKYEEKTGKKLNFWEYLEQNQKR